MGLIREMLNMLDCRIWSDDREGAFIVGNELRLVQEEKSISYCLVKLHHEL